jgi:hypothetical protein
MAFTAEEMRKLQEVAKAGEEEDRPLGFGPDLNVGQEFLKPVKRGSNVLLPPPFGGEQGRLRSNLLNTLPRTALDALQAITSPIDTARDIYQQAKGGFKTVVTRDQPEVAAADQDVQAFLQMLRGTKATFSDPETILERPLDPLLTVLGGAGKRLGSSRDARIARDPGMAMAKAVVDLEKRGLSKLNEIRPRPVRRAVEKAGGSDIVTGTGSGFMERMTGLTGGPTQRLLGQAARADANGSPTQRRLFKAYSGPAFGGEAGDLAKARAQTRIVTVFVSAMDEIKKKTNEFQNAATAELQPLFAQKIDLKALEQLKLDATRIVQEQFNANVDNQFRVITTDVPLHQIPSQRSITPSGAFPGGKKQTRRRERTGEAEVSFEQPPKEGATIISDRGEGQALVAERYGQVLDMEPTAGALHKFVMRIDDDIRVTDNPTGTQANNALLALRSRMRETLGEALGDVYERKTAQYEAHLSELNNAKIQLGVEPGVISARGHFKPPFDSSSALGKITTALGDGNQEAFATLKRIEELSGKKYLDIRVAAIRSQDPFGAGLVAKAEAGQRFRQLGNAVMGAPALVKAGSLMGLLGYGFGAAIGVPLGIASSIAFSPKALQIARLDMAPWAWKKFSKIHDSLKGAMIAAAEQGYPVSRWIEEGVTIGQFLERVQRADPGPSQEEQPVGRQEQTRSFLDRLGSIDTNPLTGVKLER